MRKDLCFVPDSNKKCKHTQKWMKIPAVCISLKIHKIELLNWPWSSAKMGDWIKLNGVKSAMTVNCVMHSANCKPRGS
jgi:hypothetical protein